MLTTHKAFALAAVVGLASASMAMAAPLVDEGFEGLTPAGSQGTAVISAGTTVELVSGGSVNVKDYGSESNVSVETKNGATFGTGALTSVGAISNFSMDIGTKIENTGNGATTNQGAGAGFGWSTSSGTINAYDAGAANVTIGVAKTSADSFAPDAPTIRLCYQNNTSINGPTTFGDPAIQLAQDIWYRLIGTINMTYNSGSGTSDFDVTLKLYNLGTEPGEAGPGTAVLTGTTTFSYAGDWTSAQPIFFTNASRGFNHMDNLYAETIPEPASLALVGLGSLVMMRRRR
jgi:hypothetical protein